MLKNKTALITGASRGIGRAIAVRFASEGALVAVHYGTRRDAAVDTVRMIEAQGGHAFALGQELGTRASVDALLEKLDAELRERTGDARFDILVNNAAIAPMLSLETTTDEKFDELFGVNVKAPFFLTQQCLGRLRDGGRIINVTSGITERAVPERLTYAMTKGALNIFTKALARALGPRGITVNGLAPGFTDTDINAEVFSDPKKREYAAKLSAFKRIGTPEDMVGVAAFLASDDAHWVTGHYMDATGGALL